MTKYIFVTGGVVSGLGKGITAASLGRLLKSARSEGGGPEAGPVYQCRPGHHEPLSARRGIRHRGRRGDRPGPGPLRALYRRGSEPVFQPHHRQGILERAHQGAPRRISGRDGAGHSRISPARSKALSIPSAKRPMPTWSSPRSAAPPATSKSSPFLEAIRQVSHRGRAGKLPVHPRHAGAVHQDPAASTRSKPTQHSVKELQSVRHHAEHHHRPRATSRWRKPTGRRSHCSATSSRTASSRT